MEHDEVRPAPEQDDRAETVDDAVAAPVAAEPDLERIAGDLADVERALDRLDDGSYWTDEITGEPIPDGVLAEDPTARRVTYVPAAPAAPATAPGDHGLSDAGDAAPEG